jgi:hypothetical protein
MVHLRRRSQYQCRQAQMEQQGREKQEQEREEEIERWQVRWAHCSTVSLCPAGRTDLLLILLPPCRPGSHSARTTSLSSWDR